MRIQYLYEGFHEGLKISGNRGRINTGGCGYWQGHYFVEITEERVYHISAEQGTGHLGD